MKNLKKGFSEHHLNKKSKDLVKELNKAIKNKAKGEVPPVKFGYWMDSEGIGQISVSIKYSEGLYGCDHGIETEKIGKVSKSDISKQVVEFYNQIINELQYYKINH
jgi:hypothetical protein